MYMCEQMVHRLVSATLLLLGVVVASPTTPWVYFTSTSARPAGIIESDATRANGTASYLSAGIDLWGTGVAAEVDGLKDIGGFTIGNTTGIQINMTVFNVGKDSGAPARARSMFTAIVRGDYGFFMAIIFAVPKTIMDALTATALNKAQLQPIPMINVQTVDRSQYPVGPPDVPEYSYCGVPQNTELPRGPCLLTKAAIAAASSPRAVTFGVVSNNSTTVTTDIIAGALAVPGMVKGVDVRWPTGKATPSSMDALVSTLAQQPPDLLLVYALSSETNEVRMLFEAMWQQGVRFNAMAVLNGALAFLANPDGSFNVMYRGVMSVTQWGWYLEGRDYVGVSSPGNVEVFTNNATAGTYAPKALYDYAKRMYKTYPDPILKTAIAIGFGAALAFQHAMEIGCAQRASLAQCTIADVTSGLKLLDQPSAVGRLLYSKRLLYTNPMPVTVVGSDLYPIILSPQDNIQNYLVVPMEPQTNLETTMVMSYSTGQVILSIFMAAVGMVGAMLGYDWMVKSKRRDKRTDLLNEHVHPIMAILLGGSSLGLTIAGVQVVAVSSQGFSNLTREEQRLPTEYGIGSIFISILISWVASCLGFTLMYLTASSSTHSSGLAATGESSSVSSNASSVNSASSRYSTTSNRVVQQFGVSPSDSDSTQATAPVDTRSTYLHKKARRIASQIAAGVLFAAGTCGSHWLLVAHVDAPATFTASESMVAATTLFCVVCSVILSAALSHSGTARRLITAMIVNVVATTVYAYLNLSTAIVWTRLATPRDALSSDVWQTSTATIVLVSICLPVTVLALVMALIWTGATMSIIGATLDQRIQNLQVDVVTRDTKIKDMEITATLHDLLSVGDFTNNLPPRYDSSGCDLKTGAVASFGATEIDDSPIEGASGLRLSDVLRDRTTAQFMRTRYSREEYEVAPFEFLRCVEIYRGLWKFREKEKQELASDRSIATTTAVLFTVARVIKTKYLTKTQQGIRANVQDSIAASVDPQAPETLTYTLFDNAWSDAYNMVSGARPWTSLANTERNHLKRIEQLMSIIKSGSGSPAIAFQLPTAVLPINKPTVVVSSSPPRKAASVVALIDPHGTSQSTPFSRHRTNPGSTDMATFAGGGGDSKTEPVHTGYLSVPMGPIAEIAASASVTSSSAPTSRVATAAAAAAPSGDAEYDESASVPGVVAQASAAGL